ncbi:MAG: alpha/beta hydrolase, partial [Deltaproteobacteria bacterium]
LWQGSITIRRGDIRTPGPAIKGSPSGSAGRAEASPFEFRLLDDGRNGLVDLPGQSMYRFPVSRLSWSPERVSFRLNTGSAQTSLRFEGFLIRTYSPTGEQATGSSPSGSRGSPEPAPSASGPDKESSAHATLESQAAVSAGASDSAFPAALAHGPAGVTGAFAGGEVSGIFRLSAMADPGHPDEERVSVEGFSGALPGILRFPPRKREGIPLVIIIAASGSTDRDGNNFNIPGKNDAYRLVAEALAGEGVASFRYDKRGSGEAWGLVHDESFLRFSQYVDDAAEVMTHFRRDGRFSRIVVAGHAEGALVAAAAINRSEGGADAFVALCASANSPLQTVRTQLAGIPAEQAPEAAAILTALADGKDYPEPSGFFADFFRPSFQGYLASWFAYAPERELSEMAVPIVFVHGGRDIQTAETEPDALLTLRPAASAFILPTMNRMLKDVPADEDENYRSITDPSFPLARGLVEVLSAVARLDPVPAWVPRYRLPAP